MSLQDTDRLTVKMDHFSNSSISSFLACPAKFYFAYIRKIEPSRKNINLEFGSSIHVACEETLRLVKEGSLTTHTVVELLENFMREFNAKELPDHKQKNANVGVSLMMSFFELIKNFQPENVIALEQTFEKRIKGYTYTGVLDALLNIRGKRVVCDHKTTSKINANAFAKWHLSRQLIGYKWLGDGDEVLVNVFHAVATKPSILQPSFYFSDATIERWQIQTLGIMEEIDRRIQVYNQWVQDDRIAHIPDALFPRVGTACNVYGCEFESLCTQDVHLYQTITPFDVFQAKKDRK